MEDFEINERDLENAMDPTAFRRPRQTKEQQIYGVWAESDSDDDEKPSSSGKAFKLGTHSKFRKANVSFVSGGVKLGDRVEKSADTKEDEDDDDDEPTSAPLFRKSKLKNAPKNSLQSEMLAGFRTSNSSSQQKFAPNRHQTHIPFSRMGEWERHTKGIGAKLLGKMGYQYGKGLGKGAQGIAEPIPAAVRPGRGAVGAYGAEATRPKTKKPEKSKQKDEESSEEEQDRSTTHWRKDNAQKKPKYKYKTMDEVLAEGGTLKHRLEVGSKSSTKVIDMTGPQQKIYSGYEAFATKTKLPGEAAVFDHPTDILRRKAFDIPELTYNLDLLIEIAEEDIVRTDRQIRRMRDENVALAHDEESLSETIEVGKKQTVRMQQLLKLLDSVSEKDLSLEDCAKLLRTLRNEFYEEYKMYGLSSAVVSSALPMVKEYFREWKPLAQPEYGVELLRNWRELLEESRFSGGVNLEQMDPYHRLVWEGWMPSYRKAVMSWSGRDVEAMIGFLEEWTPMLPAWILDNILDQIIQPRLLEEVDRWDPLSDTVPIHSWLHPWLPFMGDRLQPVFAPIRHKLGAALERWHPKDVSAKLILQPWKGVFSPSSFSGFLMRHIVPKLELCMQGFVVNPAQQDLSAWKWVLDWIELTGPAPIADLLVKHFFPKWHEALLIWLRSPNVDYAQVSTWYSGWKSLFSDQLLRIPAIAEQFTAALQRMKIAVEGGAPPIRQPLIPGPMPSMASNLMSGSPNVSLSFKDLIEKKAAENGIEFAPIPNRNYLGKPVYRFGKMNVYIDRAVVFYQQQSAWMPISLQDLINGAK